MATCHSILTSRGFTVPDNWKRRGSRVERVDRAQRSAQPGMAFGRIAQASPVSGMNRQEKGSGESKQAIFSYAGIPQANLESSPYFNTDAQIDVASVIVASTSSPSVASTVMVMVDGASIGTIDLPAGSRPSNEVTFDATLAYGAQISVKCTTVAFDLVGLTVHVTLVNG